jgi:hypothetical protein
MLGARCELTISIAMLANAVSFGGAAGMVA